MCGKSWPTEHKKCPLCGEKTDWFSNVEPDTDWKDAIALHARMPRDEVHDEAKVANWRLAKFEEAGLDTARALELAGNPRVDLHTFQDMIDSGCPVDTAYDIVR